MSSSTSTCWISRETSWVPGPSEGLKIRGCQYYLVGIICPLGWDRVNWSAKIWGGGAAPPLPRFRHPCKTRRRKKPVICKSTRLQQYSTKNSFMNISRLKKKLFRCFDTTKKINKPNVSHIKILILIMKCDLLPRGQSTLVSTFCHPLISFWL